MTDSKNPLISVITVVRNDRAGLSATRDCLMSQIFQDFEWIVQDGLSTDDTFTEVSNMVDPRVRPFSEADKSLYDAMNKGLAKARGTFVNFLNAGDTYIDQHVLEKVARALEETPEIDMLFGSRVNRYPNGKDLLIPVHDCEKWIWHSLPASHQATFMRRTVHQQHPYSMDYKVSADYHAVASMFMAGAKPRSLAEVFVNSDKGFDSVSYLKSHQLIRDCARVQREVLHMRGPRVAASTLKRAISVAYWRLQRIVPAAQHLPALFGRGRAWKGGKVRP